MVFLVRFVAVLVLVFGLAGTSATAVASSISQQITITGSIAPAKYVEIDTSGKIIRVLSNSTENAEIHFYVLDGKNTPINPTPEQLFKFNLIQTKYDLNKIGVVYDSANRSLNLEPAITVLNQPDTRLISVGSNLQLTTFVFY